MLIGGNLGEEGAMSVTLSARIAALREKAEAAHIASMNLATTLGIFHGINRPAVRSDVRGPAVPAVNAVQHDLLHLSAIRVCALCDEPTKAYRDDASLPIILGELNECDVRQHLIAENQQWYDKMRHRIPGLRTAAQEFKALNVSWAALRKHRPSLDRLKYFRNKQLGHVTVGFDRSRATLLKELWTVADQALRVARHLRRVSHKQDWDYLANSKHTRADGRALIRELARRSASAPGD
jgi:hypothetical protein